jgi:hypothetical protein
MSQIDKTYQEKPKDGTLAFDSLPGGWCFDNPRKQIEEKRYAQWVDFDGSPVYILGLADGRMYTLTFKNGASPGDDEKAFLGNMHRGIVSHLGQNGITDEAPRFALVPEGSKVPRGNWTHVFEMTAQEEEEGK